MAEKTQEKKDKANKLQDTKSEEQTRVPEWLKKGAANEGAEKSETKKDVVDKKETTKDLPAWVKQAGGIDDSGTSENKKTPEDKEPIASEQAPLDSEATEAKQEPLNKEASASKDVSEQPNVQTLNKKAEPLPANAPVQSSDQLPNKPLKKGQSNKEESEEEKEVRKKAKEVATKKRGVFDNIKNIFSLNEKERGAVVEKSFKEEKGKEKGKKTGEKISPEEKKQLLETERLYQEGLSSIRDLIAPSSMEIQYDRIRVEGMYAQSFYVFAYPRFLDTNWLSPVINFDVTMDMAQFIYPIDSSEIMKILKRKVAQMQSSIRMSQEKGNVSDPAIETALQDAEELRIQIQRGQEKFFQLGLYFTVYAEDPKKLTKIAKQLTSLLGGKLILTKKTEFQAEHAFNSTIPICLDEIDVTLNMNTSPLSSMFPFSSSELTSNKGILYGLNRHNDSLIIFDRFSLENANSVVFAKSGAGKSYAVKLEILRSLMFGTDVIVIDPENEYEAISEVVGGTYLKVSLNSDRRINPFDLPAPIKDEIVQPGDLLRQNIISLHGLLKIMLGGVTPEEEGILDKALTDTYALRGITMEVEDPSSFPPPTMQDLYDILNSMEGGRKLATRLAKYTEGTYAGLFNQPTNVDLTKGLVVFSIRDLEEGLRPIAMYIILNFIWNKIRSSLRKRLMVIDEAWSLMQHDDSAKFLYGLVKRARKYYLGITTITQDVEDFVQNKYGKPIITNSSLQLLLKQAPAALEMLQKIFNLTEGEKYMLLNSGIGQGLFFAGMQHVAIQIIASYGEDKLVTTNPEEILKATADFAEYSGAEETTEEEKPSAEKATGEESPAEQAKPAETAAGEESPAEQAKPAEEGSSEKPAEE